MTWLLPKVRKQKPTGRVSLLIYHCVTIEPTINMLQAKETPLILAVSNKKIKMEMIRTLLKDGEQNLGDKKKVQYEPIACMSLFIVLCLYIQYKMTAVHIACKEGHVEVLELFLDYNNSWKAQGLRPPKILDTTDLGDKVNSTLFFVEFKLVTCLVNVWFALLLLINMCTIWN